MLLIDILFFVFFMTALFFGFDMIKFVFRKLLPSGTDFNEGIKNFSASADDGRLTPEMVGYTAIVNMKGGIVI